MIKYLTGDGLPPGMLPPGVYNEPVDNFIARAVGRWYSRFAIAESLRKTGFPAMVASDQVTLLLGLRPTLPNGQYTLPPQYATGDLKITDIYGQFGNFSV